MMLAAESLAEWTSVDVLSIVASVASVLLAIVAMATTLSLYYMSSRVSQKTTDDVGQVRAEIATVVEMVRTVKGETLDLAKIGLSAVVGIARSPGAGADADAAHEQMDARFSDLQRSFESKVDEAVSQVKQLNAGEVAALRARLDGVLKQVVTQAKEIHGDLPSYPVATSSVIKDLLTSSGPMEVEELREALRVNGKPLTTVQVIDLIGNMVAEGTLALSDTRDGPVWPASGRPESQAAE